MSLTSLRNECESDLEVVFEIPIKLGDFCKLLVVLQDRDNFFCVHRYFKLGKNWEFSVDLKNSNLDKAREIISADRDYADMYNQILE